MPQYVSTDPNAGRPLPRPAPDTSSSGYLSTDPNAGRGVEDEEPKTVSGFVGNILPSAARFASGIASGAEAFGKLAVTTSPPALLTRAAYAKLTGTQPPLTPEEEGVLRAGMQPRATARAIGQGIKDRYGSLEAIGDTLYEDPVGAAADIATVASPFAKLPFVARATRAVKVPGILKNANAAERAAVEFARREGIPVDAATATGNRAVKAVQHVSDRSLGGSLVAERAAHQQADALAQTGERLTARAHPAAAVTAEQAGRGVQDVIARGERAIADDLATTGQDLATRAHPAALTPEQAGQGMRDSMLERVRGLNAEAEKAYGDLRTIEADPKYAREVQIWTDPATGRPVRELVTLPVDLRGVKEALDPLYQRLLRESALVPLQGEKGRALTALDRLLRGFDAVPLSLADAALSDLKAMARADIPELRTVGQGLAAAAVKELEAVVQRTAASAGPKAVAALELGRDAVRQKHMVGSVLQDLPDEPVRAFARATSPKDASIEQLRAIAEHAPDAMPGMGRAYLDDLLATATADGGFDGGQRLAQAWKKLGDETKTVLFGDPYYIGELDAFFARASAASERHILSGLSEEPVRVYNRIMAPADAGIEHLRAVASQDATVLPQLGRAYLDDLMTKATAEGGFKRADGLAQSWQRLGPETKQLLFQKPGHIDDLDHFFLLAKRMADQPNPSGTAHTLIAAGQGGWILTDPTTGIAAQIGTAALSKALHSPRMVRLLTEGLRVPLGNRKAATALAANLANTAGEGWWTTPADGTEQDEAAAPSPVDSRPRLPFRPRQVPSGATPRGQLEPGNLDLARRPVVKNADGTISTVRSMSINVDGREVLIPTVSDDGQVMTDDEAIAVFERTGRHLGVFDSPESATAYAEQLHRDQAQHYARVPAKMRR